MILDPEKIAKSYCDGGVGIDISKSYLKPWHKKLGDRLPNRTEVSVESSKSYLDGTIEQYSPSETDSKKPSYVIGTDVGEKVFEIDTVYLR